MNGWVRSPPHGPSICFYHYGSWGQRLGSRKASSAPLPPSPLTHPTKRFITDRSNAVLSLWYFLLLCSVSLSFFLNNYLSLRYIQLRLGNNSWHFFLGGGERVDNSVRHLFILWLFNCICLSFPLMLRAWCGSDCISSCVHLFTLRGWCFRNLSELRFYGPVNPMRSCRAQSVYLTTRSLGRLSSLSN